MKKKVGLIIGVSLCVFVLGLGIFQSNASETSPEMTEAEIEKMVKEQYPGEIASIEKSHTVYKVTLNDGEKGYTLEVNGDTGEILNIDEKEIAESDDANSDTSNNETNENSEGDSQNNSHSHHEKRHSKGKGNKEEWHMHGKDKRGKQAVIDIRKALNIGLNEYSGTVTEIELDKEDGELIYEVEIVSGNEKAEIDINAYTGEVLLIGTENTGGINADPDSFIRIERAIGIALGEFQGTVVEVELEEEDEGYIYEVEITSGNTKKEIEIDANTGKVVDID